MKNSIVKKLMKWIPVAVAGVIAIAEAISEQKEAERIDNIEERLDKLENEENDEEEES